MLTNLEKSLGASQNGRRLLAIPELHDDVAFCAQRDVFNLVARMDASGQLRCI
jgi:phosphosulfolactate phosphohydrolase-like enzyme